MAAVDMAPPFLKIPAQWQTDLEIATFFRLQMTMMNDLWLRTGGATDGISAIEDEANTFASPLFALQQITTINTSIDTSGFTVDLSSQTTDQTHS